MDLGQDPRRQLDWLQQIQPDYLTSPATNLQMLASLSKERGELIESLQCALSMGESLSADEAAEFESAFGAPVKNLWRAAVDIQVGLSDRIQPGPGGKLQSVVIKG